MKADVAQVQVLQVKVEVILLVACVWCFAAEGIGDKLIIPGVTVGSAL